MLIIVNVVVFQPCINTTFKDHVFQQALKTQLYSDLYLVSELLLQKRSANSFYMENKI